MLHGILVGVHAYVWPLMTILFIVAVLLPRQKAWSMILRLAYLVMIISGVWLLAMYHFPAMLVVKGILAIVLIGLMEMSLARRGKRQSVALFLVLTAIVLVIILLIGYRVI
ncbi:MAG: DUF1516 family protein [Sporolactobacillus sp.]